MARGARCSRKRKLLTRNVTPARLFLVPKRRSAWRSDGAHETRYAHHASLLWQHADRIRAAHAAQSAQTRSRPEHSLRRGCQLSYVRVPGGAGPGSEVHSGSSDTRRLSGLVMVSM